MKRFFLKSISTLVVLLLLILIGCKKDETLSSDKHSQEEQDVPEEIQSLLGGMGINPDRIENIEGGYLAEKDMFFSQEAISSLLASVEQSMDSEQAGERSRALSQVAILPASAVTSIPYYIDPNLIGSNQSYGAAVNTAVSDWTAISNCQISFTQVYNEITSGNGINILRKDHASLPLALKFLPDTGESGRASFPNGATTGRYISINHTSSEAWLQIHRVNTVRHQIGHTIGFTNNDAGSVIPGTSSSDPTSIMREGVVSNATFSDDDIKGARALYPQSCVTPTITSTSIVNIGGGQRKIIINTNIPGGTYMQGRAKSVNSGTGTKYSNFAYQVGPTTNHVFEIVVTQLGLHDVSVSVENYKGDCVKTSNTVSVVVF